ncbi:RNA polymerase sigma factor [Chryseobacterium luquanense]|uniref:Sigma-70 family RNA polymerase sigma factor n=1 Tax=Chryseobacterium luquanense TaxID=2983766 RepID=A0ABT3Y409_9FLAO|nr:sigma-70 family RNA polymerase sigma factor [Chryseobacterium luquanense]MCX8532882.1 sigma-70 family RNA polymerase sigma factor [Chryseobacterium luquanense]
MQTKLNWQKIYLDYSPKLLGICRRYIADIQTAEDIVQDSFIAAIQKNHQLKDEQAIFGWLKKIVVNNALQYIRKTSKDTFITTEPSEIPDTLTEMTTSAMDEKKHILAYDFTREELLKSIDSLPSHHKSVFNLYYIENYSHAEISGILEIPVNTSKSHLMRAKKSVQNYLLTHFLNSETPKNKTAQILIFLGFDNLLWAQTLQSKFSNFEISTTQNFEIPSDINSNTITFSSNQNHWKEKAIIGLTFFIIIVGSVLFFNPKNHVFTKDNLNIISSESNKNMVLISGNQVNNHDKIILGKNLEIEEISQNPNIEIKENLKTEKPSVTTKNSVSSRNKTNKDSSETASHKVIIVKKIIQRDTVFIER